MKLESKVCCLSVVFIVLVGVAFARPADANIINLGAIGDEDSLGVASGPLAPGAFSDWFDFKLTGSAALIATGNSITFGNGTLGTELLSFGLYEGDRATLLSAGNVSSIPVPFATFFSALLTASPLLADHQYSLGISGEALNAGANYSVSLSTAPTPVPLPSVIWLMLGGVGLLGYQARRRH